jgi:hypothetical protein
MRKSVSRLSVSLDWIKRCKHVDDTYGCSNRNRYGKKTCDQALCLEVFREVFYNKKEFTMKGTLDTMRRNDE